MFSRRWLLSLLLLPLLSACSENDPTDPAGGGGAVTTASLPRIGIESPATPSMNYCDMTVLPGGDVVAVGDQGSIYRFDGATWNVMESGVYIELNAIWGTSTSNLFAAGEAGCILQNTGSGWRPVHTGTNAYLYDIWGSGPNDVYAVGNDETILHYDGSKWTDLSDPDLIPTTYESTLRGVWGSGPNDVYFVGRGMIIHYDGTGFSQVSAGIDRSRDYAYSIWGSSASDIHIVGGNNLYLRYDGTKWTKGTVSSTSTSALHKVRGSGPDFVIASGREGKTYRRSGGTWTDITTGILAQTYRTLEAIAVVSETETYVAGAYSYNRANVGKYTGTSWENVDNPVTSDYLTGVAAASENSVYAISNKNKILHKDADGWDDVDHGLALSYFNSIWAAPDGAVFVTSGQHVVRFDGTSWSADLPPNTYGGTFNDVTGWSSDNVYIAGGNYLGHYDGTGWTELSQELLDRGIRLDFSRSPLFMTGPNDLYIGERGRLIHYNGSDFKIHHLSRSIEIQHIWGTSGSNLYLGSPGRVDRWTGSGLEGIYADYNGGTDAIKTCGFNGRNLLISGSGPVRFYDGKYFQTPRMATYEGVTAMCRTPSGTIYMVGSRGLIAKAEL